MDSQVAKVIPWNAKAQVKEEATAGAGEPRFAPLDGIVIIVGDDQLDALATTFRMSPLRKAMTFEAYLAMKGFARDTA